jgi:hypothetical protein
MQGRLMPDKRVLRFEDADCACCALKTPIAL